MKKCVLALGVAALAAGWATPARAVILGVQPIVNPGDPILYATAAPGESDRLYLARRSGVISILDLPSGRVLPTPFLTIPDVDAEGEGGLLGLAFHPEYEQNGKFYVYATVDNGGLQIDSRRSPFSSRIREYTRSEANPNVASPAPTEVISFVQPQNNHNGGWIGFNPNVDGETEQYLYITSGDGGKQRDPDNNAQTLTNDLLGKVLRIDVDGDDFPADNTRNYAIPASNPFVGDAGDDEIWSYGLRNPYRAGFDRATGDFYIADVGQGFKEEINRQPADSAGGENYAWNRREGLSPHQGGALLPTDTQPIYDYVHGSGSFSGNSVTGGTVYRGPDPDLNGLYFFADFVNANYWTLDPDDAFSTVDNVNTDFFPRGAVVPSPVSFAEDAAGNLYFTTLFSGLFRIITTEAADYDNDGDVDADDYNLWATDFGTDEAAADANLDGVVNAADYTIWRDGLSAAGSATPEPSSAALLAIASSIAAWSRSRRVA